MACEDFPCCGHEPGCCPDYDESGKQLNMKCTCGATVPLGSRYSICQSCINRPDPDDPESSGDCYPDDDKEGIDYNEGCAPNDPADSYDAEEHYWSQRGYGEYD